MMRTLETWKLGEPLYGVWGNIADIVPDDDIGGAMGVDATLGAYSMMMLGFEKVAFSIERKEVAGLDCVSWSSTWVYAGPNYWGDNFGRGTDAA